MCPLPSPSLLSRPLLVVRCARRSRPARRAIPGCSSFPAASGRSCAGTPLVGSRTGRGHLERTPARSPPVGSGFWVTSPFRQCGQDEDGGDELAAVVYIDERDW